MKNKLSVFCLTLISAGLLSSAPKAGALSKAPTGITISPAYQQVSLPGDKPEVPVNFKLTNNESRVQVLNLSAADFNTLNESGGLLFVGSNPTDIQKKYGLAKWLRIPQPQISIQPHQTIDINASVLNLFDMPAGGHYGGLLISDASLPQANKVSVKPVASSLLFVTKLGGDTHRLGLAGVTFSRNIFKLPSNVTLRFHNDGNTHLIPRGVVYLESPSGRVISKGIINDDSGIILPETYRRYYVPMQAISKASQPGKYKLRVDFRFDGISTFRSYQSSFWHMSYWLPATLALVLLAVIRIFGNKKISGIKLFRRLR